MPNNHILTAISPFANTLTQTLINFALAVLVRLLDQQQRPALLLLALRSAMAGDEALHDTALMAAVLCSPNWRRLTMRIFDESITKLVGEL